MIDMKIDITSNFGPKILKNIKMALFAFSQATTIDFWHEKYVNPGYQ